MQRIGFDILGAGVSLSTKTWLLQRTFNWQLVMPHNFSGVIGHLVSQYCQDIEFGDYSLAELSTRKYGAFQRFYAGIQTIEAVNLVFLIPVDNSVMDYFYAWYDHVIDSRGYYYPKNHYRRDIYVSLYDRTGVESIQFRLKGAFPRTHPKIHPSYAEDDALRARITLSVDAIEPSSLVGSIRKGVTNLIGDMVSKVQEMFGISI